MSLATISTAPEAADPSAPGFKRYWRSWLERTAGQQANRSGGCQARFVKLFSAQVDDAVGAHPKKQLAPCVDWLASGVIALDTKSSMRNGGEGARAASMV